MTPSDDERTSAEERTVVLEGGLVETSEGYRDIWGQEEEIVRLRPSCSWCRKPARSHTAEQRARCDAAYEAELARRRAGPVRVADVAGRGT